MAKDEKNKKNKNVKEQKSSFFKESRAELKKVTWPTPKALAKDTTTVIGIVLFVAIIVIVLDFAFLKFNESVIIKAEKDVRQKAITTQVVNMVDNNSESQNQNNEQPEAESNAEGEAQSQETTNNQE